MGSSRLAIVQQPVVFLRPPLRSNYYPEVSAVSVREEAGIGSLRVAIIVMLRRGDISTCYLLLVSINSSNVEVLPHAVHAEAFIFLKVQTQGRVGIGIRGGLQAFTSSRWRLGRRSIGSLSCTIPYLAKRFTTSIFVCGCVGADVCKQATVPSGAVASAVAGLSSSAAMRTDGEGTDGGSDGSESGSDSSSNEDERSRGMKVEG